MANHIQPRDKLGDERGQNDVMPTHLWKVYRKERYRKKKESKKGKCG